MGKNVGWIALHRSVRDNRLWKQPRELSEFEAWIYMLMEANWEDKPDTRGAKVERGSFITSHGKLARDWRWSRGSVRRFLAKLAAEKQVDQQTDTKRTLIRLTNFEQYQSVITGCDQQTDTKRTPKRPQHNKITISNSSIEPNHPEEEVLILGDNLQVRLTAPQFQKLADDYGAERAKLAIDFLDSWIAEDESGRRKRDYLQRNHNLAIRRWVFNAIDEQEQRKVKASSAPPPRQRFKTAYEKRREVVSQTVADFISAPDLIPPTRRIPR